MSDNLVEIKCPFKKKSKETNELYTCNRICVKVAPGSKGEVWCRSCKLKFDFEVDNQMKDRTFVKVQTQS